METIKKDKHVVGKTEELLKTHKAAILEELGASAFEELSPQQVRETLALKSVQDISELVRQTWLAPVPNKSIGTANFYYRWRVEFVKRYKKRNKKIKPVQSGIPTS